MLASLASPTADADPKTDAIASALPLTVAPSPSLNALCAPAALDLALRYVKTTVAIRSTLPTLKCVLLTAQTTSDAPNGQLVVTTSNLEALTSAWLAAHITTPGNIAVPYAMLADLVNKLPQNATLHLEVDAATQTLRVQCDEIVTNLKGVPATEFPQPPAWEVNLHLDLPSKELKGIIRQCVFAAATDDSRPVLTGAFLELGPNGLAFAAADGFRLALRAHTVATGIKEPLRVIIPGKVLREIEKVVGEDATIGVAVNANKTRIEFTMPNYRLIASLIEGNFPNVQSLVPSAHSTRVVVDAKAFGAAIDLALVFAQQARNLVILEVNPGENETSGTLRVVAVSAESGDVRRALPASVSGTPQRIALNGKFIKEFVDSASAPQLALQFNTAATPVLFSEIGNAGYTYVLMPMHLSGDK